MRMSSANGGEVEDSQWDLFPQMMWIDPFLDDRATYFFQFSHDYNQKIVVY